GVPSPMDFAPPSDSPTSGFTCLVDEVPEMKAGGTECFRDAEECRRTAEHRTSSYGVPLPRPACVPRSEAHCFDLVNRYEGKVREVCRTTERSCVEHHRMETGDDHIERITRGCQRR